MALMAATIVNQPRFNEFAGIATAIECLYWCMNADTSAGRSSRRHSYYLSEDQHVSIS
jgi:hypothetical protein